MTITYHAGRRIQGLDSEKTYLSASNTYNSTATANTFPVTLGGGSGSGNTKVGFEVSTGHSLVGQYLNTIQVKLAKYGTVSGTGYMSVYDSSGTLKSSSSTYNLSTLPNEGSEAYYTFTFSPPQSIANGDRIVLEGGTFNTSNQVDLYGESSNTDSNTNSVRYNSGWISESASDIHFIATTYDSITINPQSGSRFEATDTRKIYYGALPSVTYETDFSSSTGWTQVGTAMTIDTVTDQRVEFTNLPRNAEHKVYYNLGSAVSDSNWILDFKVNISSSSTSGNGGVWIGLVDSSNEIHTGSVDGLLINFFDNNVGGTEMRMRSVEYNAGALTVSSNSNTLSLSTDYFVRAIRTSATNIDFGIYTDEARTAQVGSTISKTINASTGSLDVVQITSQSVGDVGTVSGIVDDLKVYDGVTSTDFTWTEEV